MEKDRINEAALTKQIKTLVLQENYEDALAVIDELDISRIKNISILCLVGEVYMGLQRYEEAEHVLLRVYEKKPNTRRILDLLTTLYIDKGEYSEAEYYYKEFIGVASRDLHRYILRYRLDKGKGERISVLIDTLEKLKDYEYIEEWAYELAALYDASGETKKCIHECDEIVLWFGHGEYVDKAIALKCKLTGEPLPVLTTVEQHREEEERLAEQEMQKDSSYFLDDLTEGIDVDMIQRAIGEKKDEPAVDIQTPPEESVKNEPEKESADENQNSAEDQISDENEIVADTSMEMPETDTEQDVIQENIQEEEEKSSIATLFNNLMFGIGFGKKKKEAMEGNAAETATMEAVAEAEIHNQNEASKQMEKEKAEILSESVSELQDTSEAGLEEEIQEEVITEETPETPIEETISEEEIQEQEETTSEEEIPIEEMPMEGLMNQLFGEFKEKEADEEDLIYEKYVEKAEMPDEDEDEDEIIEEDRKDEDEDEIFGEDSEDEDEDEIIEEDGKDEDEIIEEDSEDEDEIFEEDSETNKAFDDFFNQSTPISESENEIFNHESQEILVDDDDDDDETEDEVITDREVFEDESMFVEDEDDDEDEISDDLKASDTVLDIFGSVAEVKSIKDQLAKTFTKFEDAELEQLDLLAPYDINFLVTGEDMSIKSQIAIGIAKALNTYGVCDKNKLVRAAATDLNQHDFSMVFEKLQGGCLVIEDADELSDRSAGIIAAYVNKDSQDVAIVLAGQEEKVKELLKKQPVLRSKFLNIIHIGKYNENELVQLAKSYASKKGYEIPKNTGVMLKRVLRERMRDEHSVNYEDIMEIVEEAIASLEKRNMKNLFMTVLDNKYEEAAMFELQPEDFDNINIPD